LDVPLDQPPTSGKGVISKWEQDEIEQDEIFDKCLLDFRRKVLDGSYREQSSIRTFLISICKRRCWQRLSRKKHLIVNMTDDLQELSTQTEDGTADILSDLYTQEEEDTLMRLIQKIGGDCQALFREYYWQQLSQKAMAAKRAMKGASSIKNKLLKCRRKLEELLRNDPKAMELLDQKIAVKEKVQQHY
jgi:RNA polymerase sigma factor (sigma-70 family)